MKWAWYLGLLLGGTAGLLVVVLFLLWLQANAPQPAITPQPAPPAADVTLFLSERALSQAATTAMGQPALIDAGPGGLLQVTTRAPLSGLEPVVHLGLALEQQESQVVSQLLWARLAFITIPAEWLPPEMVELGRLPGTVLTRQLPPEFTLVGLTTADTGLTLQFNWLAP